MTNLLKAILDFFSSLRMKATTEQEPPRPHPQETASGIIGNVEREIQAPQEVKAPPQETLEATKPEKLLWCPFAVKRNETMTVRGKYRKGYPEGAVVHFTAGSSAEGSYQHGIKENYCFFVIHEDGSIWQAFPLDSWGYHAGESFHPKLGKGVSRYLVGIEVSCAGGLIKKPNGTFETWFGKSVQGDMVRSFTKKTGNIQPGHYAKYTEAQEKSLTKLIKWLKENNPEVFQYDLVLGHDEVAPDRKNDPGGALSMTMAEFRSSFLKG